MKYLNFNLLILLFVSLFVMKNGKSQNITVDFDIGIGASYIVENIQDGNRELSPSFSSGFGLKYMA